MKLNKDRIQARACGRKDAKSFVELLCEDVESTRNPDYVEALVDELRSLLIPEKVAVEKCQAQRELRELASAVLSFGMHQNVPLSDVPRDYLHWMAKSCEDNLNLLNEYLEATKAEDEVDN